MRNLGEENLAVAIFRRKASLEEKALNEITLEKMILEAGTLEDFARQSLAHMARAPKTATFGEGNLGGESPSIRKP